MAVVTPLAAVVCWSDATCVSTVSLVVRAGAATHAGCVRRENQDRVRSAAPVFAVADGMGGHAGGGVASAVALGGFDRFDGARVVEPASVLLAVREANAEILRQASLDPALAGMGSTLAGVALARDRGTDTLAIFNVGDSRIYRLRDGTLEQISTDHSVVAELIAAGQLAPEDSTFHPERNVVTRALGVVDSVAVDSWLLPPRAGDRFLVCSDGLTNEVSRDELALALGSVTPPDAIVAALLAQALDRGAKDNVTALVLEVIAVDGTTQHGRDAQLPGAPDEDTLRPVGGTSGGTPARAGPGHSGAEPDPEGSRSAIPIAGLPWRAMGAGLLR